MTLAENVLLNCSHESGIFIVIRRFFLPRVQCLWLFISDTKLFVAYTQKKIQQMEDFTFIAKAAHFITASFFFMILWGWRELALWWGWDALWWGWDALWWGRDALWWGKIFFYDFLLVKGCFMVVKGCFTVVKGSFMALWWWKDFFFFKFP